MASGSSAPTNSSSKGFDFASDDILCSYEDYANQEASNGNHSDPSIGGSSVKEFHKSRMARSSVFPSSYPPEESNSQELITTVERTMKKHTDNLMRFLEGISSRLSQLELYCYNLDKSIGEMRSDLVRDHGEADSKLKSLDKHVQEVHRSVQILRDKQELAETQKELAKLQLAQKESSASHVQHSEDRAPTPAADPKKTDEDMRGQQLALALPHQVAPTQPSIPSRPVEQQHVVGPPSMPPPQSGVQSQTYYMQAPTQPPQGQYMQLPDSQYRTTPPPQTQSQVNQTAQTHPLPQYQQQWAPHQQPPQQVQPTQMRPSSTPVYPSYMPGQPANQDSIANSMPMQMQMPYGYSGPGRIVQQPPPPQPQASPQPQVPPQHVKPGFGVQPGDGYPPAGSHPSGYMMYDNEAGRAPHMPQQPHYPPSNYQQNLQPNSNLMVRPPPPQFIRNNPYSELIEKLVSMGYRGDHIMSVIQRQEETGQPVDFNSVLDRLNTHSSGGSQRGWSG